MKKSLESLTTEQYCGSLFDLDADDVRRKTAQEASGTSDPIERYFGVASHLRDINPNQTRDNTDNQLGLMDRKFGTRLNELLASDPEKAERFLERMRKYAPVYAQTLADRTLRTLTDRKAVLDEVADRDRAKAAAAAYELSRLRGVSWFWRKYYQRQFRGFGTPLNGALTTWSDNKKRGLLSDWLKMFSAVHKLHTVSTLRYIFFSKADKAAILTQDSKVVSTAELVKRVKKCGTYLAKNGSPSGAKHEHID